MGFLPLASPSWFSLSASPGVAGLRLDFDVVFAPERRSRSEHPRSGLLMSTYFFTYFLCQRILDNLPRRESSRVPSGSCLALSSPPSPPAEKGTARQNQAR